MHWWLPAAKMMNRLGVPYPLMNFIISGSSGILTEIKFEVTDRCNLACSFCHQDFGLKGGTEDLDRNTYERVLAQAKQEGIRVIRVTGGEPLVLKSTDDLVRRAKEMGFAVVVNTNGMALTEKRVNGLLGLVDCFKISLPAADEETMTRLTGNRSTWRLKWRALDLLRQHGVMTQVLTVMTAENIEKFDAFIGLLEPYENVTWKPLRAETQENGAHPVTRQDIRRLAADMMGARKRERWKTLALGLATPFCALENPYDAVDLFHGGSTCGPIESLTVTSRGHAVRCYSRRDPVDISKGLRNASRTLLTKDFEALPQVCRNCPLSPLCRGGCLCEWALEDTEFGRIDYLADPARIAGAEAFRAAVRPAPSSPAAETGRAC
jgi:radical SAM protein with 4Fe4S-binding SPASM domain